MCVGFVTFNDEGRTPFLVARARPLKHNEVVGQSPKVVSIVAKKTKDPAAVSLGRRGGLKGGPARAAKLSPEDRKEIAQRAAKQRWANRERKVVEAKQSTESARTKEQSSEQDLPRKEATVANGGGGGGGGYHPLIEGLIKALPPQATLWPIEARKKWLQAAAMNFDYVYNGDTKDDARSIKVSAE